MYNPHPPDLFLATPLEHGAEEGGDKGYALHLTSESCYKDKP